MFLKINSDLSWNFKRRKGRKITETEAVIQFLGFIRMLHSWSS
jgi:hypothetical protein